MADLAHWNFSDHFTAKEAASLIVGVDPGADDQNKRVPVLRRITQAYAKAENDLNAAATFGSGLKYWLETCPFDDDALLSEQMLLVVASENHYGLECYADNFPNFNFAFFTRTEICRWLKAIGLKSAYQFEGGAAAALATHDLNAYSAALTSDTVSATAAQMKEANAKAVIKPVSRSAAQDALVLAELKEQGFDPLALPSSPPGKSGVPAKIRSALVSKKVIQSVHIFEHAWQRLAKNKQIKFKN